MTDYESSGSGSGILIALVFVVAIGAAVLGLFLVKDISVNKAESARQATIQEEARSRAIIEEARARAEAIIAEAKAEADIVRERESNRTERFQSFLIAMNSAKADIGILLVAAFMIAMVVLMWVLDRRERR